MNVIVCVDNNMGVAFNNRRQSKDRILNEKILLKITGKLKVESYSESLFPLDRISIVDDVLQETGSGEWCFSEKRSLRGSEGEIEKLMICRWNRDYPSDVHLDIDLNGWQLLSTEEFTGSSHEKITMEVWKYEKVYR